MNKRFYFILFFPKEKRHTRNEYVKRRRRRRTVRKPFARIFVQHICRHESCPRVRDLGNSWIYEHQTGHKWYFKKSGTADICRIELTGLFQSVCAICTVQYVSLFSKRFNSPSQNSCVFTKNYNRKQRTGTS